MTTLWHGYCAGQDVALQASERAIIWNLLGSYGKEDQSPNPSHRMQMRDNLAGDKRIFEAVFDLDELAISTFRQALAPLLGLQASDIVATTSTQTFFMLPTLIVTFKYSPNTTNRFRLSVFGGTSAEWLQSGLEAVTYLLANAAEWGDI